MNGKCNIITVGNRMFVLPIPKDILLHVKFNFLAQNEQEAKLSSL